VFCAIVLRDLTFEAAPLASSLGTPIMQNLASR
jgi:hypothetical protein